MSIIRGSYIQKNNGMEQLKFIDKFLPLFTIRNLSDYETEIDCHTNFDLEKINSLLPEIKSLFKVSSINLSRTEEKISSTRQSLNLLKNLCRQARISYDLDKKSHGYVFAISPPNRELETMRALSRAKTFNSSSKMVSFSTTYAKIRENLHDSEKLYFHAWCSPITFYKFHPVGEIWEEKNFTNMFVEMAETDKNLRAKTQSILTLEYDNSPLEKWDIKDEIKDEIKDLPTGVYLFYLFSRDVDILESVTNVKVYENDEEISSSVVGFYDVYQRKMDVDTWKKAIGEKDGCHLPLYAFQYIRAGLLVRLNKLPKKNTHVHMVVDCVHLMISSELRKNFPKEISTIFTQEM